MGMQDLRPYPYCFSETHGSSLKYSNHVLSIANTSAKLVELVSLCYFYCGSNSYSSWLHEFLSPF